jgi:hypothetical protein
MDTGGRRNDEGMNQKARIPGTFASREEFDEARKNFAMYIATLDGWKRDGKVWLVLKGDGKDDFSQPSAN